MELYDNDSKKSLKEAMIDHHFLDKTIEAPEATTVLLINSLLEKSTFEINDDIHIPLMRRDLKSKGITSIRDIAGYFELVMDKQSHNGASSYTRYPNLSSGSEGQITDFLSKKSNHCILWCVNHYTGLNRHPLVQKAGKDAIDKYGTGGGTSAVSGGLCQLHIDLMDKLSALVEKPTALLYPTGYSANTGALSALAGEGDLILFDRDCHASIIDGCRLSTAKFMPFRHNDVNDLYKKLSRYVNRYENIFVVIESAYSMTGNISPIKEIVELKKQYDFLLYVDEAHTFGIYGQAGAGYCQEQGVSKEVDFIMGTLSKSTASMGGFVATDRCFFPLLGTANPYVFQASIPPSAAASIIASLDVLREQPGIAKRIHGLNALFRKKLLESGFELGQSKSPIIPVYINDLNKLYKMSSDCFDEGIFSVSVFYPAVKPNEGRMRFIVTASHTEEQIEKTVEVLVRLGSKYGIISKS